MIPAACKAISEPTMTMLAGTGSSGTCLHVWKMYPPKLQFGVMTMVACRGDESAPSASSAAAQAVAGVSLDRFMARHTSEDNASFNEIVQASNKRRQVAKPWLFEDKNQACLACPSDDFCAACHSWTVSCCHYYLALLPMSALCGLLANELMAGVLQVPLLTDADRMNDGFGTTGQPHDRLLQWPYENKNTMYYDSSQQKAVALTDSERACQVQVCPAYP